MSESDLSDVSDVPLVKTKRQMTQTQLDQLASARQKAAEKKALLKSISDKEKQIKEDILNKRIERIKIAEDEIRQKIVNKPLVKESRHFVCKARAEPKKSKKPVVISESDESSDEEPFGRPSGDPIIAKPVKQQYQRPLPTAALTAQIAREELQKRIQQENYNIAFQSLFPGYRKI